jgi:hypothetical protein
MQKLILVLLFISVTAQAAKPAQLKYTVAQIFDFVLSAKNKTLDVSIPFPKIYFKSNTPLKQFQDAIEKQWGQRPTEITNAFAVDNNEIYMMDDQAYYTKTGRCMDDSLAHELTHFIQSKYQKFDLNDESLEWDAVGIQTDFREKFCPQPVNIQPTLSGTKNLESDRPIQGNQ